MAINLLNTFHGKLKSLLEATPADVSHGGTVWAPCFPGVPVSKSDFVTDFSQAPHMLSEGMSRLVDGIPDPSGSWSAGAGSVARCFWDVLEQADLAENVLTAQESARLEAAQSLLMTSVTERVGGQGRTTLVPTAQYQSYLKFGAAYDRLSMRLAELRITAAYSSNERDKELWEAKCPNYEAAVRRAYDAWMSRGSKLEIEKAIALKEQLTGRGPLLHWSHCRSNFSLCELTGSGGSYQETHLAVASPFASATSDWMAFGARRDQIDGAAKEQSNAPVTGGLRGHASELSCCLYVAPIARPWLDPSLFRSRAWKWSVASGLSRPVSNGRWPDGAARMPILPVAMVFCRDLVIRGNSFALADGDTGITALEVQTDTEVHAAGTQLLGTLCRRVERSPNPNAQLAWGA